MKDNKIAILFVITFMLIFFIGFYVGKNYHVYEFYVGTKNLNNNFNVKSCYIDEYGFCNVKLTNGETIIVED